MRVAESDILFAHKLADAAGEVIRPYFRVPLAVDDKGAAKGCHFDPVTVADKGAEAAIRALLKAERPQDGILGEEYGAEPGSSGRNWVIDPIDGTRAFITGQPLWGTLIALTEGDQPVLGMIDQPVLGERFLGTCDDACLMQNGRKAALKTRACMELRDAIVMTTHPWDYFSADEAAAFRRVADAARMSRFGGDCYAYAALAMGYVDVVIETGLQPWDIDAVIPVVLGAGGAIGNWQGGPCVHGGPVVAAATVALRDEVLSVLTQKS